MDPSRGMTARAPCARRTPKNKVKVGTKKIRGVHISSMETPSMMQQERSGDLRSYRGEELQGLGDEGKVQKEDGNSNLALGEKEEQPRPDQNDKKHNEEIGDLGSGRSGELLRDKEEGKTLPTDKKDESNRCLTEVPCGGTRPPRNLIEAIDILGGEPSRRFADMDLLDILKMKGIDLTLPQRNRPQDGAL